MTNAQLINQNSDMILAALRHYQACIEAGVDVSGTEDIFEPTDQTLWDVDALCNAINTEDSSDELEIYKTLVVSTGNITKEDDIVLRGMANSSDENMVMRRDTGFFLKLYELDFSIDKEHGISQNRRDSFSDALNSVIAFAELEGCRMIELDCDADPLPGSFEVFEW